MIANACIPFVAVNAGEIEEFVGKHAQGASVYRWALYVERGPKRMTSIRDGGTVTRRIIHTGPKSPYRGFLFLRTGEQIEDEREQMLWNEVATLGTHNIAVRYSRSGTSVIHRAVHVALME